MRTSARSIPKSTLSADFTELTTGDIHALTFLQKGDDTSFECPTSQLGKDALSVCICPAEDAEG